MKIMIPFVAAVVVAVLAPASAHADGGPRRARAGQLRHRFDINRDGRLDGAERAALRTYTYARLLRRFDANRDGRVGPGELPPALAQRLRRLDVNGDGWLDPAEVLAPRRRQGGSSVR
jgi:hypothetical protein